MTTYMQVKRVTNILSLYIGSPHNNSTARFLMMINYNQSKMLKSEYEAMQDLEDKPTLTEVG